MRRFILLFTLSCSTFWLWLPAKYRGESGDNYSIGFIFDDTRIRVDTYVWMLCEHVVIIALAVVLLLQETRYRFSVSCFLLLQIADTVGWVLSYDDPLQQTGFRFNELKIVLFIFAIITESLWKTGTTHTK